MVRSPSFRFLIWFCAYVTLVVAARITDKDTDNEEKLSSTAEALNECKKSESIHIVQKNNSEYDNICLTAECVHTASDILKRLDVNVQPCDNFYKFSCGGFVSPNPQIRSTWDHTKHIVRENIRAMMEEKSSPNEPRPFRLVKDLYQSCVNKAAINKEHGVENILEILKKLGGWPVLEGEHWNESGLQLNLTDQQNVQFNLSVEENQTIWINSFWKMCNMKSKYCGVLTDEAFQVVHKYMVDTAVFLGANRTQATIELKEALEFEMNVRKIANTEKITNFTEMTVNELYATFPNIFLPLEYLEYNGLRKTEMKRGRINGNDTVHILVGTFLSEYQTLISKTPKRVQTNYIFWEMVHWCFTYLRPYLQDIQNIQSNVRSYIPVVPDNEITPERCFWLAYYEMENSINTMYQKKYVTEDKKNTVLEMFGDVRSEFKKILEKAEWMDEQARAKAMERAANITLSYAYQDELLHMKNLDEYYEKLEITPSNFLGNVFNLLAFQDHVDMHEWNVDRGLENRTKLEQLERKQRSIIPTNVILDYDGDGFVKYNSILMPAGVMSGTFFNKDRPRYINYGAIIGSSISHEIRDVFNSVTIQFDKENKSMNPETTENYRNLTQCLNDQYIDYAGINLIWKEEDLQDDVDVAAVKATYYAYKAWVKQNGPEQKLPGLSYTPEQIFWMSHANLGCRKYDSGYSYKFTEFRVNGPLWNIDEFSRDFNCPIGSKMNPVKKCILW